MNKPLALIFTAGLLLINYGSYRIGGHWFNISLIGTGLLLIITMPVLNEILKGT